MNDKFQFKATPLRFHHDYQLRQSDFLQESIDSISALAIGHTIPSVLRFFYLFSFLSLFNSTGFPRFSRLETELVCLAAPGEASWVTAFRRFIVAATSASTCYHARDYVTYGGAGLATGRINFFGNINRAFKDRSLLSNLRRVKGISCRIISRIVASLAFLLPDCFTLSPWRFMASRNFPCNAYVLFRLARWFSR